MEIVLTCEPNELVCLDHGIWRTGKRILENEKTVFGNDDKMVLWMMTKRGFDK